MSDHGHDYFLPLQDQRVFGAGITRKGIAFVPASTAEPAVPEQNVTKISSMGDRYLSIVLPKSNEAKTQYSGTETPPRLEVESFFCEICNKSYPVTGSLKASIKIHESSITHQFSLEHSHPPSHLDRDNAGLKYLSRYGWNPDSRKGLGPQQEGIRAPIKAKPKNNTTGLRERMDADNGRR